MRRSQIRAWLLAALVAMVLSGAGLSVGGALALAALLVQGFGRFKRILNTADLAPAEQARCGNPNTEPASLHGRFVSRGLISTPRHAAKS